MSIYINLQKQTLVHNNNSVLGILTTQEINPSIVNSTLAVSNIRNRTYTNCEVYLIDYGYGNFKEKIHFME